MTSRNAGTTGAATPKSAATDIRREPCECCEHGWVDGDPVPTPNGPHYPTLRCTACDGTGWVDVEYRPLDMDDLDEMGGYDTCDMGVGCGEVGICFAEAHGEPDRCGRAPKAVGTSVAAQIEQPIREAK